MALPSAWDGRSPAGVRLLGRFDVCQRSIQEWPNGSLHPDRMVRVPMLFGELAGLPACKHTKLTFSLPGRVLSPHQSCFPLRKVCRCLIEGVADGEVNRFKPPGLQIVQFGQHATGSLEKNKT